MIDFGWRLIASTTGALSIRLFRDPPHERLEHAHQRIEFRKEELAEDEGGRRAVEQEIVPFDGRAHCTGDNGATQLGAVIAFGQRMGCDADRRHSMTPWRRFAGHADGQVVNSRKEQLKRRRPIRLVVTDNQVDRWGISSDRTAGYRPRK
jgi:hypothetical protein